jgi:hypothetical protein
MRDDLDERLAHTAVTKVRRFCQLTACVYAAKGDEKLATVLLHDIEGLTAIWWECGGEQDTEETDWN